MPTFNTWYEDEEGGHIECKVTFNYSVGTPARPHDDPPEPADGEELEIQYVYRKPNEFCEWRYAIRVDESEYGTDAYEKLIRECWDWVEKDKLNI